MGTPTYTIELTKKDRVVYQVYENIKTIIVLQLLGHYNDK